MKSQLAESDHPAEETSSQAAPLTATAEARVAPASNEVKNQENTGASTAGTNGRPTIRRKAPPKRRVARRLHPARIAHPPHVAHHYESLVDEGEKDSFFGRHRTKLVIAVLVLLVGGAASFVKPGSGPAPKAPERIVSIQLPPLPPPLPPPPKIQPPPPKEEKMEQAPAPAEEKPKEAAKPKAEPAKETLGTGLKGPGGLSGLGSSGDGGGFGGPGSGGGGNKLAIFTGQVKSKVTEALRNNPRTRKAALDITVSLWVDSTGRVTGVKLDKSTGEKTLDDIIQNPVLNNLQFPGPPPPGTHMPIRMVLKATRP